MVINFTVQKYVIVTSFIVKEYMMVISLTNLTSTHHKSKKNALCKSKFTSCSNPYN